MKKILDIHAFGGNCPVQAEGTFIGFYFYFRSRGESARIEFAKSNKDWWDEKLIAEYLLFETEEPFQAGWLTRGHCKRLLAKGFLMFILNYLILRRKLS